MKVPRIESLEHRLRHAKDADGQPIALLDELLFFLDDPPPGTGDRWQEGADLCHRQGVQTSRMAVWRFYRANVLQWRREQMPPDPARSASETLELQEDFRLLAVRRAIEMLHDPRLAPGHLIGLLQIDVHRLKVELAGDEFIDRAERANERDYRERQKALEELKEKALGEKRHVEALERLLEDSLQANKKATGPSS